MSHTKSLALLRKEEDAYCRSMLEMEKQILNNTYPGTLFEALQVLEYAYYEYRVASDRILDLVNKHTEIKRAFWKLFSK